MKRPSISRLLLISLVVLMFVPMAWGQQGSLELANDPQPPIDLQPLGGQTTQPVQDTRLEDWLSGKYSPEVYRIDPMDDSETRLKKQKINVALMEMDHFKKLTLAGVQSMASAAECHQRLIDAQLDFHSEPEKIIDLWKQALAVARETEMIVKDQFSQGADATIQQVGQAVYRRLDVELKLKQAQKKYRSRNGQN